MLLLFLMFLGIKNLIRHCQVIHVTLYCALAYGVRCIGELPAWD
jgi:hypothetical protein